MKRGGDHLEGCRKRLEDSVRASKKFRHVLKRRDARHKLAPDGDDDEALVGLA